MNRYCIEVRDEWTAQELEAWLAEAAGAVGQAELRAEVHGLAVVGERAYAEVSLAPAAAIPAVLRLAATAGRALGWLDPPACDPDQRDPTLPRSCRPPRASPPPAGTRPRRPGSQPASSPAPRCIM